MKHPVDDVPFTEDLMREHGILSRVLLIYEELIRRIDAHEPFPPRTLERALEVIRLFIEEYHEKMEEDYIFPLFEKHKKEVTLMKTLRTQHTRGRAITDKLLHLMTQQPWKRRALISIKSLLKQFIFMYRAHEAREDTMVFPQVRSFLTDKEFEKLGDFFEETEHKLFGEHGYLFILHKVEGIEKELGIHKLAHYTPES